MKFNSLACALSLPVILLAGCTGKHKTFGHMNRWIPKDFSPATTVLVVEAYGDGTAKQDRAMKAYMQERYPYRFDITQKDSISGRLGKYSNTDLYRYALVFSTHTAEPGDAGGMHTASVTGFDLNFYDMRSGKHYPRTHKGSSFPLLTFRPVINTIVKKFPPAAMVSRS